jgi:hypothetical protein
MPISAQTTRRSRLRTSRHEVGAFHQFRVVPLILPCQTSAGMTPATKALGWLGLVITPTARASPSAALAIVTGLAEPFAAVSPTAKNLRNIASRSRSFGAGSLKIVAWSCSICHMRLSSS